MTNVASSLVTFGMVLMMASTVPGRAAGQPAVDPEPMTTTSVDVDGVSLRVRTAGLAGRARGQSVVIFESGGGAPIETWDPILARVAAVAPVVAYDRAGTGQSAWDSLPPTPERIAARLRRLLATLGVPPPYVLVGHSWGGVLVRYFGGASPGDVSGMVYIDPTDFLQQPADEIAIFESIGAGPAARDAFYALMDRAMTKAPPPLRAEAAVTTDFFRRDLATRQIPAAPEVPTTVILAGRPPVFPPSGLPFDTKRYADAVHQRRLQQLRGWVRPGGEFLVVANAGHFVHVDDPALVVDAIRRVVHAR